MKGTLALTAAAGACIAVAYLLSEGGGEPPLRRAVAQETGRTAASPSATVTAPSPSSQGALVSPFGQGAGAPLRSAEQRIADRRERMKEMGIATPEAYFHMPLQELQNRAQQRDVMAMLQLVAQLDGETDELQADSAYDFSGSPSDLKKRYLSDAADNGHIHSAILLAQQYAKDNAPAEALAWALYAQSSGYTKGQRWADATFANVAPAVRQAAQARAAQLTELAILRQTMANADRPR
jgi:hypothetical protein